MPLNSTIKTGTVNTSEYAETVNYTTLADAAGNPGLQV